MAATFPSLHTDPPPSSVSLSSDTVHLSPSHPDPKPKNPKSTPSRPSHLNLSSDLPPPSYPPANPSPMPCSPALNQPPPPSSSPILAPSHSSEVAAPAIQAPASSSAAIPPPVSSASPPPQPSGSIPAPASARRNPGPVPIKSYAQAASHSRGPGFVRAHAADVEAFARLPRTGVNIICGSREGVPSFSFIAADLPKVEEIYANALVMKFHGGRPSLESSHREIQSWGIENPFSIGPLSSRAFLLRFQDNKDLIRVLSRPSSTLITFPYKVFRWHNLCHRKEDSCFAPVWISLPKLPLQCFIPEFLESVANKIGRFLCIDKATATLARPSAARLCIELDLRKPPPQSIWIGLFEGLKQPIIYERMPKFCNSCQFQGHMVTDCPLGQRETRPHQVEPRPISNQSRPPPARHNVVKSSSSSLQQHTQITTPLPPASSQHTPIQVEQSAALLQKVPATAVPSTASTPSQSPPLQSSAAAFSIGSVPLQPAVHPVQRSTNPPAYPNRQEPQHSANLSPPSCALCSAPGHTAVVCPSGQREATSEQIDPQQSSFQDCTPSVRQNAAQKLLSATEHQHASSQTNHSSSTPTPPPPPPVPAPPAATTQRSAPSSTAEMAVQSPLLNQQQQDALERFKKKVRAQTQSQGQQLIGSTSENPFEALIEDQSDEEDDDYTAASFNSDTDDGSVEPIDMGYQSADGRSSHNHTKSSASVMKINKRHPNIPLNVRLRARKNSYSSSHKYLCM